MNKNILIWGAGKIGRGFIADIFEQADYQICLIDESKDLIEKLNQQKKYTVVHASNEKIEKRVIQNYIALTSEQKTEISREFLKSDLVALAVFPKDFESVAGDLRQYILERKTSGKKDPLNIILCTNLIHAGPKFSESLYAGLAGEDQEFFKQNIGIVESLIIRIAPAAPQSAVAEDPLIVWTNGYSELPVDRNGFVGQIPSIQALRLVDDMRAEELRKIYTYNMCHAVLSYHGSFYQYPLLVDCLQDDFVKSEAVGALKEVSSALQKEFGFTESDMQEWVSNVLEHTNNPTIADTVQRSAADPIRKLSKDDRLIGPTLLCLKNGIQPIHLVRGIAAAFHYFDEQDPSSSEIQKSIKELGIISTIKKYCGLGKEDTQLIDDIAIAFRRVPLEHEWKKKSREAFRLGMEYEQKYHGCGQSVIAAVTEALGIFNEEVFKSATGLCGGIGLNNDSTCSAYIGGAMAIGLIFPRERENFDGDRENKYINFKLVQQLRDKFMEEFGTNRCADLHAKKYGRPYDLTIKQEREDFEAAGAHEMGKGCTDITAKASKWTVDILAKALIERELAN